jgi:peptide/nickel transport system permease protein
MGTIFNKFLYFLFTLFFSLSLIFFMVRAAPGDPVSRILGPNAKGSELKRYSQQLGLHRPLLKQYVLFLKGVFQADLGYSFFSKKKVTGLLVTYLPPTLILSILAVLFSSTWGILSGVLFAIYQSKMIDHVGRIIAIFSLSFPIFSLAPVLIFIFAIKLKVLPVSEWGGLKHLVLPVLSLVIPLSAILAKVTRNSFLEESKVPWVEYLKAKGMAHRGIYLRILKVCMPTILNIIGIQFAVVLTGTMITEMIFDIPGVGTLLFESIQNRDYPVIQGIVAYCTIVYMVIYFFVDYLNTKIDPRMIEK